MSTWEGDILAPVRGRVPIYAAGVLSVATVLLAWAGDYQLGASPVFMPVWPALILAFDVMTVVLLVQQYRTGDNPRMLALSWAYLWSGVMSVAILARLQDAVVAGGPVTGSQPDDVVWLMAARLVGAPALVVVALIPWSDPFEAWMRNPADRLLRTLGTHATVASIGLALVLVVLTDVVALPEISDLVAGARMLRDDVSRPLVVINLVLLSIGLFGVRTRRRVRGLEAWALVALVAACGGTILTLVSARPYDVAWYGARGLGLSTAVVVLVGLLRDVSHLQTQVRGYVHRLEDQNHELTDAQAMRDHLVAVVTHDMRNPLAGLAGYLEMLEDEEEDLDESEIRHIHARSRQLTRRLTLMTEDLLASSMTTDLTVLARPVDLRTQLEECVAGFPGVDIIVRCPDDLCVVADTLRLQQVLANLVRNAQKYGAEPVRINVARGPGAFARIAVTDAGPGVPADFVARLFERYTRADETQGRGSGLGLAVSRGLAEQHGGTLDYEPETNEFVLMMPSVPPSAGQRVKTGFSLAKNALTPSVKSGPV